MHILKTLRNIVLSIVVLLGLFAAAGIAYIKFYGNEAPQEATTEPTDSTPITSLPEPSKPGPNSKESASIESLLTPAKIGSNTSVTVATLPGSTCTISVTYDGVKSKDSGLTPRKADAYGRVTWSWTINKSTPVGTWPVKATCTYNKRSAVVIGDLQVKK